MAYKFTFFDEKYLEKQYEIGNKRMKDWLGAQQSSIDQLRKAYSKPTFDPETKIYAIKDDEVVGFLTYNIKEDTAELNLPLMDDGEEDGSMSLLDFAFSTMKEKGVEHVKVNASPGWGQTMALVEKHGFEEDAIQWYSARMVLDDFPLGIRSTEAVDVTPEDHEELVRVLINDREITQQEAIEHIQKIDAIGNRVISWKIIRENGQIVAHDHLVQDIRDSSKSRMNAIFSQTEEQRDSIMIEHVNAAKRAGIVYIDNFFFGPSLHKVNQYEKYGFLITHVSSYRKDL